MTELRGWSLPEQHLVPDAVVAFVDGELSAVAHDRAASHVARCPLCAAEVSAQRQACMAVRTAEAPMVPAGLLASLRAIPRDVDLPSGPAELAVTEDGQLVAVLRSSPAGDGGFGAGVLFGSSTPLGGGSSVLGASGSGWGRRAAARRRQSAGVVVSGLVLGALALVTPHSAAHSVERADPPSADPVIDVAPATVAAADSGPLGLRHLAGQSAPAGRGEAFSARGGNILVGVTRTRAATPAMMVDYRPAAEPPR